MADLGLQLIPQTDQSVGRLRGTNMALWHPSQMRDRSATWIEHWQSLRVRDLMPLVTRELIQEHEKNPTGGDRSHSAELTLVLDYVRSLSSSTKEFVYAVEPYREFAIGRLHGSLSEVDQSDPRRFNTREAVNHQIFLIRLKRFGLIDQAMFEDLSGGGKL